MAELADIGRSVVISLVPVFVSFTVNAILKIYIIFLLLCRHYWKTAAVYQRMTMTKDNELASLKLVVERAHSTTAFFAHSNFGSRLDEPASGMVH